MKYSGTNLTSQNFIQEEIKSSLKSGNACYHSVPNLSSSTMLSKNIKINIYRTIILPFVLYECETWLLTLREEVRLRGFQNRVLRRIFVPKAAPTLVPYFFRSDDGRQSDAAFSDGRPT